MGACVSAYVVRESGVKYCIKELGDKVRYEREAVLWRRHDLVLDGAGDRRLHVSYYRQCDEGRKPGTVIFLHGCLADSRDHAAKAQQVADSLRMDAVLVDFGGCGRSSGTTTWGVEEQDDVHRVVAYVNDMRPGEPISFCAFSLGAAVAMMCAARHDNIACMVVDSSFSRLPDAMRRFVDKRLGMKGLSRPLVNWLLASVKAAHGIDLERVAPVESIRHCHMPVLFLKVEGDDTVPPESANELHAAHRGPGAVVTLVGSHNGVRTPEVVDLMLKFVDKHSSAWMANQVAASLYRSNSSSMCSCCSSFSAPSAGSLCSSGSGALSSSLTRQDSFGSEGWYSAWQQQQRLQRACSWNYGQLAPEVAAAAAAAAAQGQQQQQQHQCQQQPQQQAVSPRACAVCRVSLWQAQSCEAWGAVKGQPPHSMRRLSSGSSCSSGGCDAGDSIPAVGTPRAAAAAAAKGLTGAAGDGGSSCSRQLPTIRSQMALDQADLSGEEEEQQQVASPGASSGDVLVFV